jgi:hypothetical protein
MTRSRVFVALLLCVSLVSAPSFAAVKAGSKCSKAGTTATAGGKKFTCIKSGAKLVWNKGVTVKPAPKPPVAASTTGSSSTPDQTKNILVIDSRISPVTNLTDIAICKTEDMTPDYLPKGLLSHRNGFPRPTQGVVGKKAAKILVIPIEFNDLLFLAERTPAQQSDLQILKDSIPNVRESFQKLSAGRFDVTIDILPQSAWWKINQDNPLSGVWGFNNFSKISEVIEKHKSDFKFEGYDTYAFVTGHGRPGGPSSGTGQAYFDMEVKNSTSGSINAILLPGGYSDIGLWVHELGHSFFGFEDLYLFSPSPTSALGPNWDVPLKWDLMANTDRRLELLEWNKLLMGWLNDSEVRCLKEQESSIHYLSESDTTSDPKLLTINLSPGVTLAAEARTDVGSERGLLLYVINTHTSHGAGPILAQKFLITKGESKSMLGWKFSVLDSNNEGILIEVTKTDIDKFVPPAPKPKPSGPSQPISPIKATKGEVVPNGLLRARATWEVTGHESYRLYVIDVADSQKVFFESGYVNDSRNPIVVDITGLECNRQFRTVTEFFTKKNGEGERLVMQSVQLRDLPCRLP